MMSLWRKIRKIARRMALKSAIFVVIAFFLYTVLLMSAQFPPIEIQRLDDKSGASNSPVAPEVRNCSEKTKFVYVKMIKCASETLASVFRRFGLNRKLNLVLPVRRRIYLGWPYQITEDIYRPLPEGEGYDILLDHAVYNRTIIEDLMKPDTVYITSLREPFEQFVSMFHYYRMKENSGIPESVANPVSYYLQYLPHTEGIYISHGDQKKRHCVPDGLRMSRNPLAFNLGFPTGFPPGSADQSDDKLATQKWIQNLNKEFLLVMIVEYFDESLVMLKRLMCWSLEDILYYHQNPGQYVKENITGSQNYEMYKSWSKIDFTLYEYFLQIFWIKVEEQGPSFKEEVEHFKLVNQGIMEFCDKNQTAEVHRVEQSRWTKGFIYTTEDCTILKSTLRQEVKEQYNESYRHIKQPVPARATC